MAWQTPKTNWAAPDGVRDTDFNRIEGNILELYNESARAAKIIYVSMDGSDGGAGTSASPYKTISKALSVLPKNLNGLNVNIHIAPGTYNEAVNIKGYHGGYVRLISTSSSAYVEVSSLTVDGCAVHLSSIELTVTAAVGFIVTNGGLLVTTGDLTAESASTGVNINLGSKMHVTGTLACNSAANAVTCSGSSLLYAGTITGIGLLNATTGGIIAFNTSSLSKSTASGGRINTGSQSNSISPASLE